MVKYWQLQSFSELNEPISPQSYLLSHAQEVSILALATISYPNKLHQNTSMGVDCKTGDVNFNKDILELSLKESCELGMTRGEQVILQL